MVPSATLAVPATVMVEACSLSRQGSWRILGISQFCPNPSLVACPGPSGGSIAIHRRDWDAGRGSKRRGMLVVTEASSKGKKGAAKARAKAKTKGKGEGSYVSQTTGEGDEESAASAQEPEAKTATETAKGGQAAEQEPQTSKGPRREASQADRLVVTASDPVDGKVQVQIRVPGVTTRAIYDKTLAELARTCPPVPGARMSKGGKSTRVDPSVVLRLVGKGRVTGFVVKEVVNSTLATFVEERGLNAEKEAKTLQSAEELAASFSPGQPFAFDAELVLLDGPVAVSSTA